MDSGKGTFRFMSTADVAGLLHLGHGRLLQLLRCGDIRVKTRIASGDYLWTASDLRRAQKRLARLRERRTRRA